MLKTLLFATSNYHKLEEVRQILPSGFEVIGLKDIGWTEEIPESFETFEENAAQKARTIFLKTGYACFSEDSGLSIDALNGKPGVYSARYAGGHGNSEANNEKVLEEMKPHLLRDATFISVIAFQEDADTVNMFRGEIKGKISNSVEGIGGFGYDPIFIPEGYDKTFAEMEEGMKNEISHRAKSMAQFITYLQQKHKYTFP
jgi:XTP/dITP diphosphohydrolase